MFGRVQLNILHAGSSLLKESASWWVDVRDVSNCANPATSPLSPREIPLGAKLPIS